MHEENSCQKLFLTNLQHFELCQFLSNAHIKKMVNSAYFEKSTPLRAFSVSFKCMVGMLDILKMCMKKFTAEKKIIDKFIGFDMHIAGVYCKPCLQPISCLFLLSAYLLEIKCFICEKSQSHKKSKGVSFV